MGGSDRLRSLVHEVNVGVSSASGPLVEGDVVLLPFATPAQPEWVLLDDGARWRIVPADDNPSAAAFDVVLGEADGGPLTVRCAHHVSLDRDGSVELARTRRLKADEVERVKARLEGPRSPASAREEETAADPEYADWIELIEASAEVARQRLSGERDVESTGPAAPIDVAGEPAAPHPGAASWRRGVMAMAAVFLAVIGVGLWSRSDDGFRFKGGATARLFVLTASEGGLRAAVGPIAPGRITFEVELGSAGTASLWMLGAEPELVVRGAIAEPGPYSIGEGPRWQRRVPDEQVALFALDATARFALVLEAPGLDEQSAAEVARLVATLASGRAHHVDGSVGLTTEVQVE